MDKGFKAAGLETIPRMRTGFLRSIERKPANKCLSPKGAFAMAVRIQRYGAIPHRRHAVLLIAIVVLIIQYIQPAAISQSHKTDRATGNQTGFVKRDPIDRAIATICDGRRNDSQASLPIDQMAFKGFVPLSDPAVALGRSRAEKLL